MSASPIAMGFKSIATDEKYRKIMPVLQFIDSDGFIAMGFKPSL
jgi:hypothetical protein